MESILTNNIKSITLLIKEKDLAPVKAILKFLKEKYPRFNILKFTNGNIGEDIIVSFKVNKEYYPKVIEKFAYNDIPIIMNDKKTIELVDNRKEQKRKKLRTEGWSDISRSKKQLSISELIKLSEEGKIKEIAKEAKGGVGSNLDVVKKAKDLLSKTINNAVDNLIFYAENKFGRAEDAIDQLLLIATDKELKLFQKNEEMDNAGFAAIEIAQTHKNYYPFIVDIANNSKLNNLTNVKAAVCLANFIFNDTEEEFEILDLVVKKLNTRWLKIAYETTNQKLTESEKTDFDNLLEFVESKRKAA